MRIRIAFGRSAASLGLALLLATGLGCPGGGGDADAITGAECERDDSESPETAVPIMVGEDVEGYLCPQEDEDWYTVELDGEMTLLGVELAMSGSISPVEPTYTVRRLEDPETVVATPIAEAIGGPLDQMHCLGSIGQYYLVIRDYGDNAQDVRHPYNLSVSTASDPDTHEDNNDLASATDLVSGTPVEGAIACSGDEDWYRIVVPPGDLLRIRLESDVATYQPGIKLLDDAQELVVEESNPAGHVEETDLDMYRVLPHDGTFYVIVGDDDGIDADPFVLYTLTVDSVTDLDGNEPNNHPDEATPLSGGTVACGGSWSSWMTITGTVGSPGDNDWFRLPISNCTRGVIEAEMTVSYAGLSDEEKWLLQDEVQASVALVRAHGPSPCSDDLGCRTLTEPCVNLWDCSGLFNNCLPEGLCAGATVCLPGGSCGANQAERHYLPSPIPSPIEGSPAPDVAYLSSPIYGGSALYLRVGDFQADGGNPGALYDLRVRIRSDPDTHEPNNVYSNILTEDMFWNSINLNIALADTISLGCGTWTTGAISYENDSDWYRYAHPCPNLDCTLRINYQIDNGPVDHVVAVFRGSSMWFSWLWDPGSGHYGGTSASDSCFYASQNHGSTNYHIMVRDLADPRDWDSEQTYRICVEKVYDGCAEPPCVLWPGGCDVN